MNRFAALLLLACISCSTTASVRLLPDGDAGNIETLYKNKTVGKGNSFDVEVSDLVTADRWLTFIKDGRVVAKQEMQRTISFPAAIAGFLIWVPFLWVAPVRDQQTFDLTQYLKLPKQTETADTKQQPQQQDVKQSE